MSEPTSDGLPPLGQPTPAHRRRSSRQHSPLLTAGVALVVGVLIGIPLGRTFDGTEPAEPALPDAPATAEPTALPSTTTAATLPESCLQTIRSAQQALVLLDEGLQSLAEFDLGDVERALADMDRLRDGFARGVQECLDDPQVGTGG